MSTDPLIDSVIDFEAGARRALESGLVRGMAEALEGARIHTDHLSLSFAANIRDALTAYNRAVAGEGGE